jgi:hypothetical protein
MFRKLSLIIIIATVYVVSYAQQTENSPEELPQPASFWENIGKR